MFISLPKIIWRVALILFVLALFSLPTLFKPDITLAALGGLTPNKPINVKAVSGPFNGQVTLYWDEAAFANRYAVAYGVESNKYLYGANNIGNEKSRSFSVSDLAPGTKYYFRLAAARDSNSSPFSDEISAIAGGSVAQSNVTAKPVGYPANDSSLNLSNNNMSGPVGEEKLMAKSGPGVGEVTLMWISARSADNYHLVYGEKNKPDQYGALNIGNIRQLTIRGLSPGMSYHFALVPLINGKPLTTTVEVKQYAYSKPVEEINEPVGGPSAEEVTLSVEEVNEPVGSPAADIEKEDEEAEVQGVYDQSNVDEYGNLENDDQDLPPHY